MYDCMCMIACLYVEPLPCVIEPNINSDNKQIRQKKQTGKKWRIRIRDLGLTYGPPEQIHMVMAKLQAENAMS